MEDVLLDFNSSKSKLNDNLELGNVVIPDIFKSSVAFFVIIYHQLVEVSSVIILKVHGNCETASLHLQ